MEENIDNLNRFCKNGRMEKKFWFRRKRYGYGWLPNSREGWAVTFVFVVVILALAVQVDENMADTKVLVLQFLVPVFVSVLVLILIAWRTGEKPRWQWGNDSKPSSDSEELDII